MFRAEIAFSDEDRVDLGTHGRKRIIETLVPNLVIKLTEATLPILGDADGNIDYARLFRSINK